MARRRTQTVGKPLQSKPPAKIGEVRQSQALLTFGIGAVVDFAVHSAMPLGLDYWPERKKCPEVREADLETILEKDWFQAPPAEDEEHLRPPMLPATRFPRWLYCPRCQSLGMVREFSSDGNGNEVQPRFGSKFAFESIRGGKPKCLRVLEAKSCSGIGVPTRLVTACFHSGDVPESDHPGHIDDFPWYQWAHSQTPREVQSDDSERNSSIIVLGDDHFLKLVSIGGSLAIDDLLIKCSCGKQRSLRGVFGKDAMRGILRCKGWRPWLENRNDAAGCDRPLKVFLRGATNLHQAVTQTVISIPPVSSQLYAAIDEWLPELKSRWEDRCEESAEKNEPHPNIADFAARQLKKLREEGFGREQNFTDDDVIRVVIDRLTGGTGRQRKAQETSVGRRYAECEALRKGDENPSGNFDARPIQIPQQWATWFCNLVQVHRLREVTALQGLRRITRDNPEADPASVKYAPLSSQPMRWLPAIELRGEGIFLELDLERLRKWEKCESVQSRVQPLQDNFRKLISREKWQDISLLPARLMLVHTLAHLLIRQLTLECGYSSASLRERLYVSTNAANSEDTKEGQEMAGFLIYTSTTDSDGSLGGLVRMGEPQRLFPLLQDALRQATWCSSDPICSTTPGQGMDGLNRAACHACVLVPETSCERGNRFLDRGLIIPTRGTDTNAAFFDPSVLDVENLE